MHDVHKPLLDCCLAAIPWEELAPQHITPHASRRMRCRCCRVYEQLTAQPKRYFLHEGGGDEQEEELEEELPLEEEDYEEEDLTQQQQEQQQEQEQQEAQQAEAAAAPSAEQEAKRAGSRQHSAM